MRIWKLVPGLLAIVLAAALIAPAADSKSGEGKKAANKTAAAQLKLTPDQQRGLDMLKVAIAKAGALDPAMRAAVLWQGAHGYGKIDRDQVRVKLKDAFRAATSAEDEHADVHCFFHPDYCHSKPWLELQILQEMVSRRPKDVEDLLPQAEPEVRRSIMGALISKNVRDGHLDHASELLGRTRDEKEFPYDAASTLMLALPRDQRQSVFDEAVSNYRDVGKEEDIFIQPEDLGTLIVRFSHELPVPTVLEAIDLLLKTAKEKTEQTDENQVTFGTSKGSVSFSAYEYRLFELLPVLEDLDPPRAKSLLEDHAAVSSALQKHPAGLASLDPRYRDTPLTKEEEESNEFTSISFGNKAGDAVAEQAMDTYQRQLMNTQEKARDEAKTDPKAALETALSLPLWGPTGPGSYSPRGNTLAEVAVAVAQKDATTADRALDELRKFLDQMKLQQAGHIVTRMITTYQKMNDSERAEKAFEDGMKVATKIYEKDKNADNPNLALKAEWPSAALWRKLVTLSMKTSSQAAQELIAQIPDDEIRVLEEVAIANSLLGAPSYAFQAIEWHADGNGNLWAF